MKLNKRITSKTERPVKVLQYGTGNFLRGFAIPMIDIANEAGVFDGNIFIVKPTPSAGEVAQFRQQDCMYTVILRGTKNGEPCLERRVITSVADVVHAYREYDKYSVLAGSPDLRFIVSNTTEAGIVYDNRDDIDLNPPNTFPGKLTKFLFERYQAFDGAMDKGLIIIPLELIERNGETLREYCIKLANLWGLPKRFILWLTEANTFCNTLVDRIVTGYPADEADYLARKLGYLDEFMVVGEPFAQWVIESDGSQVADEFPLDKAGLPVIFTSDLSSYRAQKVRLLNGTHTALALAAYLSGLNTVLEMMNDKIMREFVEKVIYEEIAPTVPFSADLVLTYADSVIERFENPFIKHNLLAISINSIAKFKARILPIIIEIYEQKGALPRLLCFALAALMEFYDGEQRDGKFIGMRSGEPYEILDDPAVLAFFIQNRFLTPNEKVRAFLARADFWDEDLTNIKDLPALVTEALQSIRDDGMQGALHKVLGIDCKGA